MAMSPLKNTDDVFAENMNIITEELGMEISLEDYYKMSVQNLEIMMEGYKITEEGDVTISELPAKYLKYDYETNGIKMIITTYLAMDGKKAYVLNFGSSPETSEEFDPLFGEILASFRIEK